RLALNVEPDRGHREDRPRPARNADDRAQGIDGGEQDRAALGRRIELADMGHAEARPVHLPDIRTEAVAAGDPDAMSALARMRRRVEKVAAELADILEARAPARGDVVPELRDGEFLANEHRAAGDQRRADAEYAAGGVVHRQAVVDAVV